MQVYAFPCVCVQLYRQLLWTTVQVIYVMLSRLIQLVNQLKHTSAFSEALLRFQITNLPIFKQNQDKFPYWHNWDIIQLLQYVKVRDVNPIDTWRYILKFLYTLT